MEDLSAFCCQNPECPDYGKRGLGNLSVTDHYGPENKRRVLRCATCQGRFSERKGTPLFDARLPEEKVVTILAHLTEGCGVRNPYQIPPQKLKYATVHKTRKKGRVVKIDFRVIFATVAAVLAALKRSQVSQAINTAFVERQNGTDRNRNARKVRKTYCFSKDWDVHQAMTYFTMYTYNFCWAVRTLREQVAEGQWRQRTPAMAAGLTDHLWSLSEWLSYPSVQR